MIVSSRKIGDSNQKTITEIKAKTSLKYNAS